MSRVAAGVEPLVRYGLCSQGSAPALFFTTKLCVFATCTERLHESSEKCSTCDVLCRIIRICPRGFRDTLSLDITDRRFADAGRSGIFDLSKMLTSLVTIFCPLLSFFIDKFVDQILFLFENMLAWSPVMRPCMPIITALDQIPS